MAFRCNIVKLMCGLVRPRTLAGLGNMSTIEGLASNVPEKSTKIKTKNSIACVHWDVHWDLCESSSSREWQSRHSSLDIEKHPRTGYFLDRNVSCERRESEKRERWFKDRL